MLHDNDMALAQKKMDFAPLTEERIEARKRADDVRIRDMAHAVRAAIAPKIMERSDALCIAEILLEFIDENETPDREVFAARLKAQGRSPDKIRHLLGLIFD